MVKPDCFDAALAHLNHIKDLGFEAWPTPESAPVAEKAASQVQSLDAIRCELGDCTRCKLHTLGRQQIVFGVGNPRARLMFIGEGPGADEDAQGEPFVGRAGQLLNKIIEAIGMTRAEVYIANTVKCRPPKNRAPEPDELAACEPFWKKQIQAVRPEIIVTLGSIATHTVLNITQGITKIRGRFHDFQGIAVMPTFHPAYLLRSPDQKRFTWEDMKMVRDRLKETQT